MQPCIAFEREGEVVAEWRMSRVALDQLFLRCERNVGKAAERDWLFDPSGVKLPFIERVCRQGLPHQVAKTAALKFGQLLPGERLQFAIVEGFFSAGLSGTGFAASRLLHATPRMW